MAKDKTVIAFAQAFDPETTAFGRHETFPLRYSWLTKGVDAIDSNPNVFTDDAATVKLGVGNNMVKAIRYWLLATRMAERNDDGSVGVTDLGNLLILGAPGRGVTNPMDKYLEDEGTLWLLHWLLATNSELATSWYWFFNHFHKRSFTSQEVTYALEQFVSEKIAINVASKTIGNDAQVVLRMYSKAILNKKVSLEDVLDSPLSLLNLVSPTADGKTYTSALADRDIPVGIFTFAVLDLLALHNLTQVPIRDMIHAEYGPSLAAIFRLTESALDRLLEQMVMAWPKHFELRETAGIHQLHVLEPLDIEKVLKGHYASLDAEEAA